MARIFSIEFTYKDSAHRAMITVRETAFYKEFKISLQDTSLGDLLPSDRIISSEPGKFAFVNSASQQYNDLSKQILAAVAGHLHSLQH